MNIRWDNLGSLAPQSLMLPRLELSLVKQPPRMMPIIEQELEAKRRKASANPDVAEN